jgi:NADH-quinone oxidoreductase subunit E
MVQVFKDTYEDLTAESFEAILDAFAAGETPTPGPQNGRHYSAPIGGAKVLTGDAKTEKKPRKAAAKSGRDTDEPPDTPKARKENAGRPNGEDRAEVEVARSSPKSGEKAKPTAAADEAHRPAGLETARDGRADDLKKISGVGPKIEGTLNSIGIFHFDQIAAWTPDEVEWVDGYLKFKGRIDREDWIAQAKILADGGETEFSKRTGKRK